MLFTDLFAICTTSQWNISSKVLDVWHKQVTDQDRERYAFRVSTESSDDKSDDTCKDAEYYFTLDMQRSG